MSIPSAGRVASLPTDAAAAADWLRDLARALKTSRLYRPDNPVVAQSRERLALALAGHLERFGAWTFHFTPEEIRLGEHVLVRPAAADEGGAGGGLVERLPFLVYRDGIREITFLPGIPQGDVEALVDALVAGWTGQARTDDLITALWQANPTHIRFEALPLEQTLFLSSGAGPGGEDAGLGLSHGLAPDAQEIRADLVQSAGPLGLHKDAVDLDAPPLEGADVESAYQTLAPRADREIARLAADWERERAQEPGRRAIPLLRRMAALDPSPETREAVAHLVVTWIAAAVERSAWEEARAALDLRRELDPEGEHARHELVDTLTALADERLGDAVDDAGPERQARFFGFLVGLGTPGVPLALAVLSGASYPSTRAAAGTALSYLCAEEPALLAHALTDPRAALVADLVQVLGQIGGPEVAPLLAQVAHHRDAAVQREVAAALAAVPLPERTPILLEMLASPDGRALAAVLRVARLEHDPTVAQTLLALIESPEVEARGEETLFALFQALADAGDDEVVPALEGMLLHGGWFARPSARRTGAARTLARLGGPLAVQALEEGLRSRSRVVRAVCREALEHREAA